MAQNGKSKDRFLEGWVVIRISIAVALLLAVTACGTTDSTLQAQGHNDSFIIGFHDGRHSGMREAGNNFEHYVRDQARYDSDEEYRSGWIAGEEEGRRMQAQADAVGNAAAAGVSSGSSGHHGMSKKDIEKAARNATKGVDTSELEVLTD
jgi:hypothetical protein